MLPRVYFIDLSSKLKIFMKLFAIYFSIFLSHFCDLIEVSVICENIAEHNNNKNLYDFFGEVDRKVPDWRENHFYLIFDYFKFL